jgi:hypothetical protein
VGHIISAKAYANNEIALIARPPGGVIQNCLGFEITRIYLDSTEAPE